VYRDNCDWLIAQSLKIDFGRWLFFDKTGGDNGSEEFSGEEAVESPDGPNRMEFIGFIGHPFLLDDSFPTRKGHPV
jgi:hypothetical protein